uniref:Uncharacterized protein n=1 Tax=Canis lupus dingo TaxID=286419 RepID=A0A8C0JTE9_CANLU
PLSQKKKSTFPLTLKKEKSQVQKRAPAPRTQPPSTPGHCLPSVGSWLSPSSVPSSARPQSRPLASAPTTNQTTCAVGRDPRGHPGCTMIHSLVCRRHLH